MRSMPENITKELLEQLYLKENKSLLQIAKVLNKSNAQISRYLKRFEIPARAFSTKGTVGWAKGTRLSAETKNKMRKYRLGKTHSPETREKIRNYLLANNPFKGRKHSEESKEKQRLAKLGKKLSPEHRKKLIEILRPYWGDVKGEKSHGWRGGISPINARLRSTKEYRKWATEVKERDNYTCVWCGLKNKSNHADHIAPFSEYPELRLSLDNGRTLCSKCHRKTDTYGFKNRKKNKILPA